MWGEVLLPSMTKASTSSAPICSSCCMVSKEISLNSTAMPMNVSRRILAMFCSWDRPLESNMQESLSTKQSHSITLDSGSFPVIIVSASRSMQSGNLLINTNTTPHCLFWESILHTLVITTNPAVVRKRHTADACTFLLCVNWVEKKMPNIWVEKFRNYVIS